MNRIVITGKVIKEPLKLTSPTYREYMKFYIRSERGVEKTIFLQIACIVEIKRLEQYKVNLQRGDKVLIDGMLLQIGKKGSSESELELIIRCATIEIMDKKSRETKEHSSVKWLSGQEIPF